MDCNKKTCKECGKSGARRFYNNLEICGSCFKL
jgi:hypothetical protein